MKKYAYILAILPIVVGIIFYLAGQPFKYGFRSTMYGYWVATVVVAIIFFLFDEKGSRKAKSFILVAGSVLSLNAQESLNVGTKVGLNAAFYSTFKPMTPPKNYCFSFLFMKQVNNFQGGIIVSNTAIGLGGLWDFNNGYKSRKTYTRIGLDVCYNYVADYQTLDGIPIPNGKRIFICPYIEQRLPIWSWLVFYGQCRAQSLDGLGFELGLNINLSFNQ